MPAHKPSQPAPNSVETRKKPPDIHGNSKENPWKTRKDCRQVYDSEAGKMIVKPGENE